MPPWFIDIESATDAEAKSNGTPPASRTAAHASRANSPSSALHGVTRESVEATPMNGFCRSAFFSPSACRNARCGARSSPSTVMRDGSFFVFTDYFFDTGTGAQAERLRPLRERGLRNPVHDGLDRGVGLETYFARGVRFRCVPHLLGGDRDAGEQHGAFASQLCAGDFRHT